MVITINILKIFDYEDLCFNIFKKYREVENNTESTQDVSIIARYKEMKNIVAELVKLGFDINFIADFKEPETNGYSDEYILILYENEIWLEPFKNKFGYFNIDTVAAYILENCSSKIIPHIDSNDIIEVQFYDDENINDTELLENVYNVDYKRAKKYLKKARKYLVKYDKCFSNDSGLLG